MDPEPSQAVTTSTSTESESSLKHMPAHDVAAFGVSCDLSGLNLPTIQDILRYYFFLTERAKIQNKIFSYKTFTPHVIDKLIEIWSKLDIEITHIKSIAKKLNTLLDKYQTEDKHKTTSSTYAAFVQFTKELFYIGKCECDLKAALCSCGLIPENLKEFMMDQHNERKSTIPEYVTEIEEQVPTTSTIIQTANDSRDPEDDMEFDDEQSVGSDEQDLSPTTRGTYMNFAMMCDRFGVSDRIASALATSLMKDIGEKDDRGNLVIMDKSKVRREKAKSRQEVLRKRYDASNLIAFSFDGRKNDSLTMEKIDKKFHPRKRIMKESHLVVLKEPNSQLLGYTKVENEDSEHKVIKLNEFFVDKAISLDSLIGICCDGEPANTDIRNGILRRFETQLNRPLHWFVCLLHFNELPLRHLFDTLEKSSATGPRTTGTLNKQIETCENLPPVNDFEVIALENIPDLGAVELTTDAIYLYRMVHAISSGAVSADLANIKPGPIAHSRWLTKASRLLRLYVTTNNPSKNLKILANYIMKVYTPMYFNIKHYNSVVYGSVLFCKFIRWTQYLDSNLRGIVNNVVKDNAYYAHSENILLAMLFDDEKKIRDLAVKKILHYRNHVEDPMQLRVYKKPMINFNCVDYMNMIDLNDDSILFEPPFTLSIPYEQLQQYLKNNDLPLPDPKIPLHIQETEKHVPLLASLSKRVLEQDREGVVSVTLERREKFPRHSKITSSRFSS
ncbi:uncharacterized protein LOC116339554 [Contarinia nasturtii]|uniref:uncharacterized protein LOC116339554 n=1 Tax=Contarinia nasturtii TaxID=265458 RepID=UPI0012D391E9|nr:uncharacterized protein LOC116339554 [Contarinia nasturtii]